MSSSNCRDHQASAPQTDVAALHKQLLEQQHSQNAQAQQKAQPQGELCLPGRIESTTAPAPPPLLKELPEVVDLPPLRKGPTSAAADAEFDYDRELKKGAALGGAGWYTNRTCLSALMTCVPNWGTILRAASDVRASVHLKPSQLKLQPTQQGQIEMYMCRQGRSDAQ